MVKLAIFLVVYFFALNKSLGATSEAALGFKALECKVLEGPGSDFELFLGATVGYRADRKIRQGFMSMSVEEAGHVSKLIYGVEVHLTSKGLLLIDRIQGDENIKTNIPTRLGEASNNYTFDYEARRKATRTKYQCHVGRLLLTEDILEPAFSYNDESPE